MEVSLLTWHAQSRSVTVMTLFVKNILAGLKFGGAGLKFPLRSKMGLTLLSVKVRQSAFLGSSTRGLHFRMQS
jgi:hypothetical protein